VRLADFIMANIEPILAEWVAFAATCGPAGRAMDRAALRDHAVEMLKIIVTDLGTPQTGAEQTEKSRGNAPYNRTAPDTAAEVHGAARAESGFTLEEMVSEYRALRASVIRLWTEAEGSLTGADLEDLMRFNEAIDQALAESVTRYTQDLDQSKELFIAILGHDLRSPISAVITSSQFMLETGGLQGPQLALMTGIVRSSRRMNRMVGDLLDFTRIRLGPGIPVVRQPMDMGEVAADAVAEMRAANPERELTLEHTGNLRGEWDAERISQVLANLLGNAVHHGSAHTAVGVTVAGDADGVVLRVHNRGAIIPAADVRGLFSPLKRLRGGAPAKSHAGNLGLGLYIAERIVTAHGGTIEVSSTAEAGTAFTVRLPRSASADC
jgi:signal transduction histidine kinase